MKKPQIFVCIFCLSLLLINESIGQTVTISGPSEVCPSYGPTYTYTYTATSSTPGCFGWSLIQNGQTQNLSFPCSCNQSDPSSSINISFDGQEGSAIVRVTFRTINPITCKGNNATTREISVQKRVFGPGMPFDADGGNLTICPGETKIFYIPGVPGPPNSVENCNWHHKWIWTAPAGWQINGGSNTFLTGNNFVSVTAPSNAQVGGSTFFLTVVTEPAWPVFKQVSRQIHVGYSENVVSQGPGFVCATNSTFNVQSLPTGTGVSWTKSSNIATVSGQNTNNYVVKAQSSSTSGAGWVRPALSGTCGNVSLPQRDVWVGKPASPGPLNGSSNPSTGNTVPYFLSASSISGSTSIDWALPYCFGCTIPWSFASGTNSTQILANVGTPDGYVQVWGVNVCGLGGASMIYVNPSGNNPQMMMYPNPAHDELFVQVNDEKSSEVGIMILDQQQKISYSGNTQTGIEKSIDVRNLKRGTYIIQVAVGEKVYKEQLVIE